MPYNQPMSEAITFDTHATVKKLMESGIPEEQAEAIVSVQVDLVNSNLATKHDISLVQKDIEELRAATKHDIEELRAATQLDTEKLRTDMANVETRLTRWIVGFGMTIISLMVTFFMLLRLPT